MIDQGYSSAIFSSYQWAAITKSDSEILNPRPRAIFVGGAGNIALVGEDGNGEVFTVPAGMIIPTQAKKVLSTGTDATNIIGLY